MQPQCFKECNAVLAKDQPQYRQLPVCCLPDDPQGRVISCWALTWRERACLLLTGRLWLSQLTFGHLFQPVRLEVAKPAELRG